MELITGVERWRQWRLEDKLRIVAEAEQPGACLAAAARRHKISRSVLWAWRKQVRGGLLPSPVPAVPPVPVTPDPPAAAPGVATDAAASAGPA